MPLYQQEEDTRLTVDFGGGRSLTLKMRGTDLDIQTTRKLAAQAKRAEIIGKRSEKLTARASEDMKSEEFQTVLDETEKLQGRTDGLSMMVDYVFGSASGWVDNFINREAEARGEVLPYTRENVEKIGLGALQKICEALNGFFRFEAEAAVDDPKALTGSLPVSPSEARESLIQPTI